MNNYRHSDEEFIKTMYSQNQELMERMLKEIKNQAENGQRELVDRVIVNPPGGFKHVDENVEKFRKYLEALRSDKADEYFTEPDWKDHLIDEIEDLYNSNNSNEWNIYGDDYLFDNILIQCVDGVVSEIDIVIHTLTEMTSVLYDEMFGEDFSKKDELVKDILALVKDEDDTEEEEEILYEVGDRVLLDVVKIVETGTIYSNSFLSALGTQNYYVAEIKRVDCGSYYISINDPDSDEYITQHVSKECICKKLDIFPEPAIYTDDLELNFESQEKELMEKLLITLLESGDIDHYVKLRQVYLTLY